MTMFKLTIGSSPWGEDCAQTAHADYEVWARKECRVFTEQLKRFYATTKGKPIPEGLWLTVTENPHDFGIYFEVAAVVADEDNSEAVEAAEFLADHGPEEWDEQARTELGVTM